MSLAEQWTESASPNSGEEEPAGARTGRPDLTRLQLLDELALDSPPPEAIAAAKLLFANEVGSEGDPTL